MTIDLYILGVVNTKLQDSFEQHESIYKPTDPTFIQFFSFSGVTIGCKKKDWADGCNLHPPTYIQAKGGY